MAVATEIRHDCHNPAIKLPPDILNFQAFSFSEQKTLLELRTKAYLSWGDCVARSLSEKFGPDSNEAIACNVFRMLAPSVNAIFISQAGARTDNNTSWSMHNPRAASEFKVNVLSLLSTNSHYANFFERNPETGRILNIVASELLDEAGPEKIEEIALRLECLALEACRKGNPVILFVLDRDPFHTKNPFEADLRLILPVPKEEQTVYKDLLLSGWEIWKRLTGVRTFDHSPEAIIGDGIGFAGAELVSKPSAENLNHPDGFHITINLLNEHVADCLNTMKKFGEMTNPLSKEQILKVLGLVFGLHEAGHNYTGNISSLLDETAADLPAAAAVLKMAASGKLEIDGRKIMPKEVVLVLLGANIKYGKRELTERMDVHDAYPLSARWISSILLSYGIIISDKQSTNNPFRIVQNKESLLQKVQIAINEMAGDFRMLYNGDIPRSVDAITNVLTAGYAGSELERLNNFLFQPHSDDIE